MARFSRLETHTRMVGTGLVPIVSELDVGRTVKIAQALAEGGATVIEFTNRGDGALEVYRELAAFCARELPDVALGIGSVSDAATAASCANLGAAFVVGPVLDEETARFCNRRKVAYLPGAATPGEIARAEELGAEIVKVFPGDAAGGPDFVRAVRGPQPWSWLMPTGGVAPTDESIGAWFDAGVVAVGMGSKLIRRDLVAEGRWDELRSVTASTLELVARHNPRV